MDGKGRSDPRHRFRAPPARSPPGASADPGHRDGRRRCQRDSGHHEPVRRASRRRSLLQPMDRGESKRLALPEMAAVQRQPVRQEPSSASATGCQRRHLSLRRRAFRNRHLGRTLHVRGARSRRCLPHRSPFRSEGPRSRSRGSARHSGRGRSVGRLRGRLTQPLRPSGRVDRRSSARQRRLVRTPWPRCVVPRPGPRAGRRAGLVAERRARTVQHHLPAVAALVPAHRPGRERDPVVLLARGLGRLSLLLRR
jgi:hypothetical protein